MAGRNGRRGSANIPGKNLVESIDVHAGRVYVIHVGPQGAADREGAVKKNFTCCKCHREQDGHEEAAWDGNDRSACYDCFRKWGWQSFGKGFSPYSDRP